MFLTTFLLITAWLATSTLAAADAGAPARDITQQAMAQNINPSAWQAPLSNCDLENKTPGRYIVYLTPGTSLKDHKDHVGKGLPDSIIHVSDKTLFRDKIVYLADFGEDLLSAVRSDAGVELVECALVRYPS